MQERDFDVVIIGSGAGGGAVAKELAPLCREGLKIAVLEWGPKLREAEFTGRELEMVGKLYFDGGGFFTKDRAMTLAFAKAYGGSTVVYTGTSLKISKKTVERWAVPGLGWEDLDRRSDKYVGENSVHLLEPEKVNDNNRLFKEGCEKLGWKAEQFPVNLKGCRGSGMCNLGCPNAAKQGTHRVQLPAAQAQGVEVVTNCRVERVGERELEAVVDNPPYGEPSAWAPGRCKVRAKVVVVSAGAVGSPALLLRSGFGARLPALGRYFTAHPALFMTGQHERAITNYQGHPKSYYCDDFSESERFLLETCMYFPFVTAKNLAGFGPEHSAMMAHMDRLQMVLILALDRALASNRVTVDAEGRAVVDYRLSEETIRSLVDGMKATARVLFSAGARRVHAPAAESFFIEREQAGRLDELIRAERFQTGKISVTSAHLMGGCRMGSDPATSVTDAWGRVHGLPWLYVADASLFPACAEINPYVTIMALADRVAEGIRSEARALTNAPAEARP